jgi:uncharacterized protein YfaP (DUF2135 family)
MSWTTLARDLDFHLRNNPSGHSSYASTNLANVAVLNRDNMNYIAGGAETITLTKAINSSSTSVIYVYSYSGENLANTGVNV